MINPFDGMKFPAKSLTLHHFDFEDLIDFRLRVVQEVRLIVENACIESKDLILSYRMTKTGAGTAIYNNDDYQKFLKEYELYKFRHRKRK